MELLLMSQEMKIIKRNIKNLIVFLFVFLFVNNVFAITFSEPWEEIEYYKNIERYENKPYDGHSVFKNDDPYIIYFDGDEPDISDGDLEDKIGDFDIY